MVDDKLLARHLVQTNSCSRELLLEGRRLQREAGDDGTLYDTLLTHGLVEEAVLVDAAATLLNLPSIELEQFTFDEDLVGLITRDMAIEHQVIPLRRKDGGLMLAMTDPLDIMAMDDIATHIGSDIQPVIVGRMDLAEAVERTYPDLQEDSALDLGVVGDEIAPPLGSNGLEQDSWATFFDDAVAVEVDRESASISQEMRDRPTSLEMSLDELGIEDTPGISSGTSDILESFDAPPPRGAGTAGDDDLLELGEWEVDGDDEVPDDDALRASPGASGEADYGVAGDHHVHPEGAPDWGDEDDDEPVFVLDEIVEDEEDEENEEDEPIFVLDEIVEDDAPDEGEPEDRDIFEDVFAEVADDAGDAGGDDFEVLAPPESEPEPEPELSALSSLRARLASVKLNTLPKPSTTAAKRAEPDAERDDDEAAADAAPSRKKLGRVAIKRIAVKRQASEIVLPDVVEKNSAQERNQDAPAIDTTREVEPGDLLGEGDDQDGGGLTLSHEDLFDSGPPGADDSIELGGFELDASDDVDFAPTREFDPGDLSAHADPPTREVRVSDLPASDPPTREVLLDDVFGSLGEGVGGESTNASEDVQSEIEELSRSIRKPASPMGNRFSGEFSPGADMNRETTANAALTRDSIAQMSRDRRRSQAGTTSSSAALLSLPEGVSEGQLLRALVTVLLDRKLIDRAELIELAEALPHE